MKRYLHSLFDKASSRLDYLKDLTLHFEIPPNNDFGDLSCNAALLLSKKLKRNPRTLAAEILENLEIDKNIIYKTEIAGPGFINFFYTPAFVTGIIAEVLEKGDNYGRSNKFEGKRANVEFVSANPTGPLTVGHGRNAVCGDTVANLLEWVGYKVDREYYFNNAGRQMRVLGDSVRLRYLELLGEEVQFPDEYYQGEYIKDIAEEIKNEFGASLKNEPAEGKFKIKAEQEIFADIEKSLISIGIKFDLFFNENLLYSDKKIESLLGRFKEKNLSYEKDGAVWLKLSELGNEQDKVIVKSTGEPTYRLPDIAYHITKFERNYDLIIDLFGSDHNATYPDVVAGLQALGYDTSKMKVLIHQFVTIVENGEIVKMSTRKANYITLDELVDEAKADAVRYFFNMRNISSHMNFDLALAKKQSDENPVFYLQYAHARICSILKMVSEQNLVASTANLHLLSTDVEIQLIKKLHQFSEEILNAALQYEIHHICVYLEELAAIFHKFYTFCRILGTEKDLAEARLALIGAVKIVIKNGLKILGVNAPDKM
ncbi:MAG: arginine--tRNA ligase [Ignavibacteriaceae bacterium]|nr:arginine--tRNA ligase [Ignavibacteriaceae bacterium]